MGLFDMIISEMPLPDFPEDLEFTNIQSKCTPAQAMVKYKIASDGQMYEEKSEYEWVEDESILGGHFNTLYSEWVPCNFTKEIVFYQYWHHEDYDYQNSIAFETGNVHYKATVVNGKVTDVKCTGKVLPVKLTDEEVEERLRRYEESSRKVKEKMTKSRKESPTPTQKLVDDISNQIANKPAISDQSDYIKVINNIEKLIEEWRDKHDPWYEKEKV